MTELRYGRKWCPKCRTLKPLDKFYTNKGLRFGVGYICKKCRYKQKREALRNNPKMRARKQKYHRERFAMLRTKVFEKLGGVFCVGFDEPCKWKVTDIRCLQIDHVQGDGAEDRKNISPGHSHYTHILNDLTQEEARSKYQILCANCNMIKAGLERVREQPTN